MITRPEVRDHMSRAHDHASRASDHMLLRVSRSLLGTYLRTFGCTFQAFGTIQTLFDVHFSKISFYFLTKLNPNLTR